MTEVKKIDVNEKDLSGSLRQFLQSILALDSIEAILVPRQLPMENRVMPALVTDPSCLTEIEPLAPAFPLNGARIVSRLTRKPTGKKVAAVLRPCEMRAFVELVKLNQGSMEEVVLIGLDCLGAYTNRDYFRFAEGDLPESTRNFYRSVLFGEENQDKGSSGEGMELSTACRACTRFLPENADIHVELLGAAPFDYLPVRSCTPQGDKLLSELGLPAAEEPPERKVQVRALFEERDLFRKKMVAETGEAVNSIEKMSAWFAACVNCYNCRVVCPVCYCRECVFVTDVFDHEPAQYLRWAEGKGVIKVPTDTVFFHMTRLAHMSHACVGCGQCSNACPNDIKVMEVFSMVAEGTQKAFDYEAGRSIDEPIPLSVFYEKEFEDVVGIES